MVGEIPVACRSDDFDYMIVASAACIVAVYIACQMVP